MASHLANVVDYWCRKVINDLAYCRLGLLLACCGIEARSTKLATFSKLLLKRLILVVYFDLGHSLLCILANELASFLSNIVS